MIEMVEITDATGDAELMKLMRKASDPDVSALVVHGTMDAPVRGGDLYLRWIEQAIEAPVPLCIVLKGGVGQRGLALALTADIAFTGPDATFADDAVELPGLAALAVEASGPALARALLLGGGDPHDQLAGAGLLRAVERPLEAASAWANAASIGHLATARRAIRAARRLPLREALEFDIWLDKPATGEISP